MLHFGNYGTAMFLLFSNTSKSCFREAVEHFLSALSLQHNSRGPVGEQSAMSDNIWSTMRMALALMDRTDLHAAVDARDIQELSKHFPASSS